MTSDELQRTRTRAYRPALRGLVLGLFATGLRLGVLGAVLLAYLTRDAGFAPDLSLLALVMIAVHYVALACGLVGVSYAAIAWHRGERGAQVVAAFVFSVVGVVADLQIFPFVAF